MDVGVLARLRLKLCATGVVLGSRAEELREGVAPVEEECLSGYHEHQPASGPAQELGCFR